jgi:TetR/AcrR family transcriptional repressor of nem operon
MPWEKQFDPEQALQKAMQTFWARGYEATSMQDLVDTMGINRGSLYATFGDKRSLFLQALKLYGAVHRKAWTDALAARTTPRGAILGAFDGAISAVLQDGSRDGCLVVNTALELSAHDDEIAAEVADSLGEMERFFRTMIEAGQKAGEIPASLRPAETARALLGLFVGLRVLARSRPEPKLLRAIAEQAAAMLG